MNAVVNQRDTVNYNRPTDHPLTLHEKLLDILHMRNKNKIIKVKAPSSFAKSKRGIEF